MTASAATRSRVTAVMREVAKQRGIDALAPHIQRSWDRCLRQYGMQPAACRGTLVLPTSQLRERRQHLGALLDTARAEMESLCAATGGCAVALSDADGTILATVIGPALEPEFRGTGLSPGACWDEQREGTNGIGTSLVECAAASVRRGEHFRNCNIGLSCTGAPIVDARGHALAVLCAASANPADTRATERHTAALVGMAASRASHHWFLDELRDAWILRFDGRPEFVGLLQEGLVAIDGDGRILALGDNALPQLGDGSREGLLGQPIETLFDFDASAMHRRAGEPLWLVRDLARGRRFHGRLRPPRAQRPTTAAATTIQPMAPRGRAMPPVAAGDARMQRNLASGRRLLAAHIPILLRGGTGTGKRTFAHALHACGPCADRPFVTVDCAAPPQHAFDPSHPGGPAAKNVHGCEDPATGDAPPPGTLFFDELGDLPLAEQARLMRWIAARRYRATDREPSPEDGWYLISSTQRDLPAMIAAGEFRADLYYRLAGATLELPQLKDRSDKGELIDALLRAESTGTAAPDISADARRHLLSHGWPGNIRELRNVLRAATALCTDDVIRPCDLPHEITDPDAHGVPAGPAGPATIPAVPPMATASALRNAECDALARVLSQFDWNIARAARALTVSRNTLYRKLRKHGITPPGHG